MLDCGGYRGGYSEGVLTTLANIAKDYKVNAVIVEPNFGDGMFNKLLEPVLQKAGYPVTVLDAERSSAQKERRIIDCLEPVLNQHKLVVNQALILEDYKSTENLPAEEVNRYRLFYQLTRTTKDKGALVNDDRIDAVALGVHYKQKPMVAPLEALRGERRARPEATYCSLASWGAREPFLYYPNFRRF